MAKALRLHLVSGVGVLVLVGLSALLWLRFQERFPHIAPGEYIGVVEKRRDRGATEDSSTLFLLLSRGTGQTNLEFTFFDPLTSEVFHDSVDLLNHGIPGARGFAALRVMLPKIGMMRMSGAEQAAGEFRGRLTGSDSQLSYVWQLTAISGEYQQRLDASPIREKLARYAPELYPALRDVSRLEERMQALDTWSSSLQSLMTKQENATSLSQSLMSRQQEQLRLVGNRLQVLTERGATLDQQIRLTPRVVEALRERDLATQIIQGETQLLLRPRTDGIARIDNE